MTSFTDLDDGSSLVSASITGPSRLKTISVTVQAVATSPTKAGVTPYSPWNQGRPPVCLRRVAQYSASGSKIAWSQLSTVPTPPGTNNMAW